MSRASYGLWRAAAVNDGLNPFGGDEVVSTLATLDRTVKSFLQRARSNLGMSNEEFQRLPETYRATNIEWTLLERSDQAAIYTDAKGGFEVFRIQRHPARTAFGKAYPAREAVPPAEDWGTAGWSFLASDRAGAYRRYEALNAAGGSVPPTSPPTGQEPEGPGQGGGGPKPPALACELHDFTPRLADKPHPDPDAPPGELAPPDSTAPDGLRLYAAMRRAVEECAAIDEAAGIKDRAARLEAYARIRDDKETEVRLSEIRTRAMVKIGELSQDLGKGHKVGQGTEVQLPVGGKLKAETLADANISTSAAHRYEALAGPKERRAEAAAAREAYYSQSKAAGEVIRAEGLQNAVTAALTEMGGKPVKAPRKPAKAPRKPDRPVPASMDAWANLLVWLGGVDSVTDSPALAAEGQDPTLVKRNLEWCDRAFDLVQAFKTRTQELYPEVEAEQ